MEKLNGLNLQAKVQGKLRMVQDFTTKDGRKIYRHILVAPAGNEYDHPNTVSILGGNRLGDDGDVVECIVQVRGKKNTSAQGNVFYNHELWIAE